LTNPDAGRYVGFMIRSQNEWFYFSFTSAGAAHGPSGVGRVL
jgi:hypothetical protein